MPSNWLNEWKAGWHGSAPATTGHNSIDVLLALVFIVVVIWLGLGALRSRSS